jgi:probable HAF family extracellular repeat protein
MTMVDYHVIGLGGLLSGVDDLTTPYGINAGGQITGEAAAEQVSSDSYLVHAFRYDGGQMIDLGTLGPSHNSTGHAINSNGDVVGFSQGTKWDVPDHFARAFRYSGAKLHDIHKQLAPLGFGDSVAWDINDAGDVVGDGIFGDDPSTLHAWLYRNGEAIDLTATVSSALVSARAINNAGQIAGIQRGTTLTEQTFIYDLVANTVAVATSQVHGEPFGMNEAGDVVGWEGGVAFLLSNGQSTALPTLGGDFSLAVGINASRLAVGWSLLASGDSSGFVDDADKSALTDLSEKTDPATWEVVSAHGINDAGVIIATAQQDGRWSGVRLVPHEITWPPRHRLPGAAASVLQILIGIIQDGPGWYIGPDGHLHHVGPGPGDPGPVWGRLTPAESDALLAVSIDVLATAIHDRTSRREIRKAVASLARDRPRASLPVRVGMPGGASRDVQQLGKFARVAASRRR